MSRPLGAVRIFSYNWPTYLATWGGALGAGLVAWQLRAPPWTLLLGLGATIAAGWSLLSLGVSYYVYDYSPLSCGRWLLPLLPSSTTRWSGIDAGLDAEVALDAVMPGQCAGRIDIYDPATMGAASVRRARQQTLRTVPAVAASPGALPLDDASCDCVLVVFTAHEIRCQPTRERFFAEVKRTLRPGGRMLVVEHVRDLANFVAFGPGCLHFQTRREWLRLARLTGLAVAHERRVTPWIRVFAFEKEASA